MRSGYSFLGPAREPKHDNVSLVLVNADKHQTTKTHFSFYIWKSWNLRIINVLGFCAILIRVTQMLQNVIICGVIQAFIDFGWFRVGNERRNKVAFANLQDDARSSHICISFRSAGLNPWPLRCRRNALRAELTNATITCDKSQLIK